MSTDVWTIARVSAWMAKDLSGRGFESPRLDADLMVCHALGLRRIDLYVRFDQPLNDAELARIRAVLERRRKHEPIAYILGTRDFYGHTFAVDARVLIPRPETEGVVDAVLERLPPKSDGTTLAVADLCAGSGAIGISLALARDDLSIDAVELSAAAAEVCRANMVALKADARMTLHEGSLYKPLGTRRFDVVVSNPPYIATAEVETLMPDVSRHEPRLALDGGPTGDTVLTPLVMHAPEHLTPGGWLVVELGADQGPRAIELAHAAGLTSVAVLKDLAKLDRVLVAQNL